MLLGLAVTGLAIGAVAAVGWVVHVATTGPTLDTRKPIDLGATSAVYADDGTRLGFISGATLRVPIAEERHPARRPPGDGRDRGPPLLQAQGRRLRGHPARRGQERRRRRHPGRLDADDAARPQPLHGRAGAHRRRRLQAQDPRGQARRGPREPPPRPPGQDLDPRQVPELRALRHGRRPDRGRPPGRRRGCSSTSPRASSRCARRRCWPASRRRRRPTTRSWTRSAPSGAATRSCRRWPTRATSARRRRRRRCAAGSASGATGSSPSGARATSSTTSSPSSSSATAWTRSARAACASTRRSTCTSSAWRARTWRASSAPRTAPRRSSRSTPARAGSRRWRPPRATATRSSTSPRRATARPGRPSRSWCS